MGFFFTNVHGKGLDWPSEHMSFTGLTGPVGRKDYLASAAPFGCGRTTSVMMNEDKVPHWERNGEEHSKKGINFQGKWREGMMKY
jgi:GTP-dependent phosphoenolpyruvate carboxykinase